ncbi:glycosyltransferase [Exiguobacterium sp. SH4S7]|uniref:glycosyltransferase n=1 Tax=Exiguobacterium sp. SH4S7 TaxID=2510958 RepID=UPI00103EC607|nr:glycosyltransferase [Exiguobacterium sp. SH4S7]TCI36219.1 glycosyltransferase [Exiguobacterium sp. SH4S7]
MKKVLHLLSSNSYSGAENVAISSIKMLENKCKGIYVSPAGPINNTLQNENIEFVNLDKVTLLNLTKIVYKLKPDIIHAHDFRVSILSSLIPKKVKKISHIHQNPKWIKTINFRSLSYFLVANRFNKIVTVSDQVFENSILFKDMQNHEVIANPLNINKIFEGAKSDNKNFYDIVFVGRLVEEKNPQAFISYIKKLTIKLPDLKIAMIGDGPLRNECEELIEKYNLNNNIDLKGFIEGPYSYIKNAKLVVMTSKSEGYGLVAIESMILKTPILIPPVGGLKTIANNIPFLIYHNREELMKKSIELLSNQELRMVVGEKCEKEALKLTDEKKWREKWKKIYKI